MLYRAAMLARQSQPSPTDTVVPAAPQGTTFHSIIEESYPSWITRRTAEGKPVCAAVQKAFERFLQCGDPDYGHAALGCQPCDYKLSIPLPCNQRAWCPTCLARRMRTRGQSIVDDVFGTVPVRHWVEGLPPQLKRIIGYDAGVLTLVLQCFVREIFRCLRRKAKLELGLRRAALAHPGAVSIIHLCSGDLTPNTHFHCIVTDGVFVEDADGNLYFIKLSAPTAKEVANVAKLTCRRTCRILERRKLWRTTRSGKSVVEGVLLLTDKRPAKFFGDASSNMEGGAAPRDGAYPFHVWAGHPVEAGDRDELERLVHYVLAPPLRYEQVTIDGEGNVVLRLKRPRHDGTIEVTLTHHKFLDALAELIPRDRKNTIRYHGVYAPNNHLRPLAVPQAHHQTAPSLRNQDVDHRKAHARVGSMSQATCPKCSGKLQLVAVRTLRFSYRNPHWIEPDSPRWPPEATIETGTANTPTVEISV